MTNIKLDTHPINLPEEEVRLNMLLTIPVLGNSSQRASVIFRQNGEVITDLWGSNEWRRLTDQVVIASAAAARKNGYQSCASSDIWDNIQKMAPDQVSVVVKNPAMNTNPADATATAQAAPKDKVNPKEIVKKWFDFFSEFNFEPQVRFINSIARMTNVDDLKSYVIGYFELTNNSFARDIAEKTKSVEFKQLAQKTINLTEKKINQRLEVYYGPAGSGKTTTAIANNPTAKVVLCHASLTPDELFRGFDFEEEVDADGHVTGSHPIFKGCALREAMENGLVVILDEINLLNEDCRRALQAVTDAKGSVTINNDVIQIKDGFKVIGTMNLTVGDMTFPLPDPLVDRCEVIKRYTVGYEDVAALAI